LKKAKSPEKVVKKAKSPEKVVKKTAAVKPKSPAKPKVGNLTLAVLRALCEERAGDGPESKKCKDKKMKKADIEALIEVLSTQKKRSKAPAKPKSPLKKKAPKKSLKKPKSPLKKKASKKPKSPVKKFTDMKEECTREYPTAASDCRKQRTKISLNKLMGDLQKKYTNKRCFLTKDHPDLERCGDDQYCDADTGKCVSGRVSTGQVVLLVDGRHILGDKATLENLKSVIGGDIITIPAPTEKTLPKKKNSSS
jgi:hypothetical protein